MWRKSATVAAAWLLSWAVAGSAPADEKVLKIGVLTDLSSVFTDLSGQGAIEAVKLAVEDFGGEVAGVPIEVVSADMLHKADVGAAIVREWVDVEGVSAVVDVPNSAVALAINEILRDENKVFLASGNISTRFTGDACTPNTVHWTIDNYAIAKSTAQAVLENGGDTWYFITQDIASGHDMEMQAQAVIEANGGEVLGAVRYPLNNPDFSSYLLQAQASGAKIIALLAGGGDFLAAMKQAREFGITGGDQQIVGMFAYVTEYRVLGPEAAQGTLLSAATYWDLNDRTRAFAERFAAVREGRRPTQFQAGAYSATRHYLKAVEALGGDFSDGKAVVAKMKELPVDDDVFGEGVLREDGRNMHPIYLFEVKGPEESTGEWDLYKLVGTTPTDAAWRPLEEGNCPLVTN